MNSSSSLFVNLLISLDFGQVEIFCDNQLGPLIQLLLFDDNFSGKHPLDGRYFFPGRWHHISVQIAYTVSSHFESILTLLLSWLNIELLILEIFLLKQSTHYVPTLASNRLLINSNWSMISTLKVETLVFAAIICDNTCPFL